MTPVSEKKLMITRMQSFLQITTPIFTQQFLFFPQLTNFFYGAIIERFFQVTSALGWLSPEQKGFLLGAHWIQEHTHLLKNLLV